MTLVESLKRYTTVVADTGDIEAIARHRPQDATTNPSLLYHAAQMPAYRHLVDEAAGLAFERGGTHEKMAEDFIDRLIEEGAVFMTMEEAAREAEAHFPAAKVRAPGTG